MLAWLLMSKKRKKWKKITFEIDFFIIKSWSKSVIWPVRGRMKIFKLKKAF